MINKNIERISNLTPMQLGILYHKNLDEDSSAYILQQEFKFMGEVNLTWLEQSISLIGLKYDVFRSFILYKKVDQPRMVVMKKRPLEYQTVIFDEPFSEKEKEKEIKKIKNENIKRGFDFEKDTLLRVTVVKFSSTEVHMIWCTHHIILDGWCFPILFRDFFNNYEQLSNFRSYEELEEKTLDLKEQLPAYGEYVKWLESKEKTTALNYWSDLLDDYDKLIGIQSSEVIYEESNQISKVKKVLSQKETSRLKQLGTTYLVTISTIVETAWGLVLQAYNHTDDVVFGKVVSGRNGELENIEQMVGLFVNTIPVRVQCKENETFLSLLKRLQQQSIESSAYDFSSLVDIQQHSQLQNGLFDTLFVFENFYINDEVYQEIPGLKIESIFEGEQTNYPITVKVFEENALELDFVFDTALYNKEDMESLANKTIYLLQQIVNNIKIRIDEIEFATPEEQAMILSEFNHPKELILNEDSVVSLIEETVATYPDDCAITCNGISLTYSEFNQRANQVAHFLRKKGVQPNDFVGLVFHRSIEMFIAIFAVLKSGAAYVPIEPSFPQKRISYIIQNCKPKLILTNSENLSPKDNPVIEWTDRLAENESTLNLTHVNQSEDLCYCIYTSGTTGNPKGVLVKHLNVINLCKNRTPFLNEICLNHRSIVSVTNYTFDIFVTESLFALSNHVPIIVADDEQANDPQLFSELLLETEPKIIQTTPSKIKFYLADDKYTESFKSIKVIILGGEVFIDELYLKLKSINQAKIFNGYGPSEATVWSTGIEIKDNKVTIGYPIINVQVYIVNNNKLVGSGVIGEIVVAGDNVGRGYLNNDELTNQQFKPNLFGEGLLYHTGDLGTWSVDGRIHYISRIDSQYKIRGYRIELGEIENVLAKVRGIKNVAVIVRKDSNGDPAIYAYVISDKKISITELRNELKEQLPEYMIPAFMMQVDAIPYTTSGKLAVSQLPDINEPIVKEFVAPRNELEAKLVLIYQDVLKISSVSIFDSFFTIGGHSLNLTSLVNRIEKEIGVRLPLKDVFKHSSVSELAEHINQLTKNSFSPIPIVENKAYYPVSYSQLRMFALNEIDNNNVSYNLPICFEIDSHLSFSRLQKTFQIIVDQHETLRTEFLTIDGSVVQHVRNSLDVVVNKKELQNSSCINKSELIKAFIQPFDLSCAPLIRLELILLPSNRSLLLLDMHHIISDGVSLNLFVKEFADLYNGHTVNNNKIHYKDYSKWLLAQDLTSQEQYWIDQFQDVPILNFPLDYPRPSQQNFSGKSIKQSVSKDVVERVKSIAKHANVTEFMVYLSVFTLVLSRYSMQEDLVIGTPISGRSHPDTENMFGLFVNTLALRLTINKNQTFDQLLEQVKQICLEGYDNQLYPFEQLVDNVDKNRSLSRNPLFDVMFVYQNKQTEQLTLNGKTVRTYDIEETIAKFDLTFTVEERDVLDFQISINYCTALFNENTMTYFLNHYNTLLENAVTFSNQSINSLSMTSPEEQSLILDTFNATNVPYDKSESVQDRLKKIIEEYGEKEAVVCLEEKITYKELNRLSDSLAWELQQKGFGKGDIISIMMTRSIEVIIAQVAVIKTGAAFVSIDPDYPDERISFILGDSHSRIVLTNVQKKAWNHPSRLFFVEIKNLTEYHTINKVNGNQNDLMYCIYTSGTTGNPKGVMIKQQGIMNLNVFFKHNLSITDKDNVLQFANYVFDASVFEIYAALLNGSTLHIATKELIDDSYEMSRYISDHIDFTVLPPQYLMTLDITRLRILMTAGSSSSQQLVKKVRSLGQYINAYGPSEATVCASTWVYSDDDSVPQTIPIGKPIPNTHLHVYQGDTFSGIGVPGELLISGDGVGMGYLNLSEQTSNVFIKNPFDGKALYRTGDLVRWLPDGNLEFMGRIDKQVKIRGYRIELTEIELTIRKYPDIKDVTVITRSNRYHEDALYAYLVVSDADKFDLEDLQVCMSKLLPEYMVPKRVMILDSLPTTLNGKLDEKALPEIMIERDTRITNPENELERQLLAIFEDVIGVSDIGVLDDFYSLGGDSISAIRIVSKLRELGYHLTVKDILQNQTVRKLSYIVLENQELPAKRNEPVIGKVPLTPIQTYFYSNHFEKPNQFNQGLMLQYQGHLQVNALELALSEIVSHHDILRAVFIEQEQIVLSNEESEKFELSTYDCSQFDEGSEKFKEYVAITNNSIQSSFNLKTGPLLKVAVYKGKKIDYLLLTAHHLVIDAISWRILLSDLEVAYNAALLDKYVLLPPKTTSYKEWSEKIQSFEFSEQLQREVPYWKMISDLVIDNGVSFSTKDKNCDKTVVNLALDEEYTTALLNKVHKSYGTNVTDILITALGKAMFDWDSKRQISVQLEGHGREELFEAVEIDRTIGWFTSIYPVIVKTQYDSIQDLIETKEMLRQIPNNGIGYSIIRFGQSDVLPDITTDIMFNYLGIVDSEIDGRGQFQLSNLPTGQLIAPENSFPNKLQINGRIVDNQLRFMIESRSDIYSKEALQQFSLQYESNIKMLVDKCMLQTKPVKTASDYGLITKEDGEDYLRIQETLDVDSIQSINHLTPMQSGILYYKLRDEKSSEYMVQQVFKIDGAINDDYFKESLINVSEQFDILKTAIFYRNMSSPKQVIVSSRVTEIKYYELNDEINTEKEINEIRENDLSHGFDLETDNLFRVTTIKKSKTEWFLLLSAHHIILDGWSFPVIFKGIMDTYVKLEKNSRNNDLVQNIYGNYSDYVTWILRQDQVKSSLYWENLLSGYETIATIPSMNYDLEEELNYDLARTMSLSLSEDEMSILLYFTKENKITINTVLEVAWGLVLQEYNRTNDIVFGKVVSGRNAPIRGIETMVGLFVNTIPVRVKSDRSMSVMDVVTLTQKQAVESSEHDYSSLSDIQQQSELKDGLFDTLLVFENYYIDQSVQEGIESIHVTSESVREETNYSLTVKCVIEDTLRIEIMYSANQYGASDIHWLLRRIRNMIVELIDKNAEKLEDIQMCDDAELTMIQDKFFHEQLHDKANLTAAELFEYQLNRYASNIAVIDENESLTYGELNKRANQFANYLIKIGVRKNDIVAVITPKNVNLLVILLAIVKTGGAYAPIDYDAPEDRIQYMLKNSNSQLIVIGYESLLFDTEIEIELYQFEKYANESEINLPIKNQSNDVMYCIYTSGTTGRPKGVLTTHGNFAAFALNLQSNFSMQSSDRVGQFGTYIFDAFMLDVARAFVKGIPLVIIPKEIIMDSEKLELYWEQQKVTSIFLNPTYYFQLPNPNFRHLITGGAATNLEVVNKATAHSDYYNVYGPTETTVIVTTKKYSKGEKIKKNPTIGPLLPNVKGYIVNNNKRCGIGVIGELWIGGPTVSKGYVNQPELTKERFFENPFGEGRIYKTGDLVRWLPNGDLDYIGRLDKQVQIRGYRVELGEIEYAIRNYETIEDAVVIEKDGELLGYFVCDEIVNCVHLKHILGNSLPAYMIPEKMMQIPSIPFTLIGKVDERALPLIESSDEKQFITPSTESEIKISEAFSSVLHLNQISCNDDFFLNGGDSIKVMSLLAKLRIQNYNFSVQDIFNLRTVANLATYIDTREINSNKKKVTSYQNEISFDEAQFSHEISELKQKLLQYESSILSNNVYKKNTLSSVQLTSYDMNIISSFGQVTVQQSWDEIKFIQVWKRILNEFPILGSSIRLTIDEQERKEFEVEKEISCVPFIDISKLSLDNQRIATTHIVRSLNMFDSKNIYDGKHLMHGLVIVKLSDIKFTILLPISHLIFDGFSNEVLTERITELYRQEHDTDTQTIEIKDYDHYNSLMKNVPINAPEDEIISLFNLYKVRDAVLLYHQEKNKEEYSKFQFKLSLNDRNNNPEKIFNLIDLVLNEAYNFSFPNQPVPMLFVQTGRNYREENFSNYVGEFLDLFPLLVGKNEKNVFERINEQSTYCGIHNVNLVSLRKEKFQSYKQLHTLLNGINLESLNVPIVNILLMYQENDLINQDVFGFSTEDNEDESSNYVTVSLKNSVLIFDNLECKKGMENKVKSSLSKLFDKILNT